MYMVETEEKMLLLAYVYQLFTQEKQTKISDLCV